MGGGDACPKQKAWWDREQNGNLSHSGLAMLGLWRILTDKKSRTGSEKTASGGRAKKVPASLSDLGVLRPRSLLGWGVPMPSIFESPLWFLDLGAWTSHHIRPLFIAFKNDNVAPALALLIFVAALALCAAFLLYSSYIRTQVRRRIH